MCHGTGRCNTFWPLPARAAELQCGTFVRTTSSLKSATTATECVVSFFTMLELPNQHELLFFPQCFCSVCLAFKKKVCFMVVCLFLDALLWAGLEPGSGHSAGVVLGGRSDACHPDVGLTFCYLSSEDFRESHTVNTPVRSGTTPG